MAAHQAECLSTVTELLVAKADVCKRVKGETTCWRSLPLEIVTKRVPKRVGSSTYEGDRALVRLLQDAVQQQQPQPPPQQQQPQQQSLQVLAPRLKSILRKP